MDTRTDLLYVINVLSLLHPLIGEVGGVRIRLALQNCILGHV